MNVRMNLNSFKQIKKQNWDRTVQCHGRRAGENFQIGAYSEVDTKSVFFDTNLRIKDIDCN